MEVVYPCCCGLDVHKKSITAGFCCSNSTIIYSSPNRSGSRSRKRSRGEWALFGMRSFGCAPYRESTE